MKYNALVLSYFDTGKNRIFEDYCNGVKNNCENYFEIDYKKAYKELGRKKLEQKISMLIEEKNINCLFFFLYSGDLTFDIFFIEKLSEKCPIVMNFFDTHIFFEACDRYYAQLADLVILPGYYEIFPFQLLNIPTISTFPLYDSFYYKNSGFQDMKIDVSFVGDIKSRIGRKEKIDYLHNAKIDIHAFGKNTENGFVDFNRIVEIFNESKINLNFSSSAKNETFLYGKRINNRKKIINGRIFEIALCGGFVLSEYAPGLEHAFEIGEEIDIFSSKEELLEKIKYYLNNETERKRIAQKGYEKAISTYDVTVGFKKIFEEVTKGQNSLKEKKEVIVDRDFYINYTAYRYPYIAYFFAKGRLRNFIDELSIFFEVRKVSLPLFIKTIFFFGRSLLKKIK